MRHSQRTLFPGTFPGRTRYARCPHRGGDGSDWRLAQFRPAGSRPTVTVQFEIPKDVWFDYVNGIFTKTICEARNLNKLKQAAEAARGLSLLEGVDWGYINDKCLTDLTPENEDGTTTVGIWFKPLPDDVAHEISRKYPLYRD